MTQERRGGGGEQKLNTARWSRLTECVYIFRRQFYSLADSLLIGLPSLPAFRVADKLLARAVAAFISAAACRCESRWQAQLTNQLYSHYIAAPGPICNADGVPVLTLEAVMYSLLSLNHEGS